MKKKTGLQLLGIYYYLRAMHYQYWKSPISKFCFASFYKYRYCALLVWHFVISLFAGKVKLQLMI